MISCLTLERPGTWRPVAVAVLFAVTLLPAAPLLFLRFDGDLGLFDAGLGVGELVLDLGDALRQRGHLGRKPPDFAVYLLEFY